jgi:hypothetical protein
MVQSFHTVPRLRAAESEFSDPSNITWRIAERKVVFPDKVNENH